MELIIFGFAGLVTLVIYGGLLLLPAVVAFYIGRLFGPRYLRWLFAGLAIGVPVAWAFAGYDAFREGCASLPKQEFISHPENRPESIRINSKHVDAEDLIERGVFRQVEEDFSERIVRRYAAGERKYPQSPIPVVRDSVPVGQARSAYLVTESEQRLARWWNPPLFIVALTVSERDSGRELATATDLVFGGGILGEYLQIFWGDQDFDRLSCGYASPDIDAWRPTLSSRPRFAQYREADAAFVSRAVEPSLEK